MDVQEFEEAAMVLYLVERPIMRNGIRASYPEIETDGNVVTLSWVRENRHFGKWNITRSQMKVEYVDGEWQWKSPPCGGNKANEWWPGFCRWAKVGELFDPKQLFRYYSGR